jgi:hypothetical protein
MGCGRCKQENRFLAPARAAGCGSIFQTATALPLPTVYRRAGTRFRKTKYIAIVSDFVKLIRRGFVALYGVGCWSALRGCTRCVVAVAIQPSPSILGFGFSAYVVIFVPGLDPWPRPRRHAPGDLRTRRVACSRQRKKLRQNIDPYDERADRAQCRQRNGRGYGRFLAVIFAGKDIRPSWRLEPPRTQRLRSGREARA